ncbi:protein charlatan isoform X2 [Episyrphus balteatus]|uniref:protein charlatan isoform X2 n=1 Tax=Episyrphus balteatus TaxID=286459 RepID=UPI002484FFA8|nr:protein charlatan isoform X2 [Episyrphus balteatus]XP_055853763.1 protein charlatan isoform X2 [Episyrphus balteatus]
MATLIQSAYVEAAYEDMFKEITRKLYGEETGNGLHTLGTPVAQVATSGPTAPEGERSFTNLVRLPIDRSVAPTIEYDHNNGGAGGNGNGGGGAGPSDTSAATSSAGNFKSEDQLSTAFGLAALMQQNGFSSSGTILGAQTIQKTVNPSTSNSNVVVGNAGTEARWTGAIPVTVSSGGEEIVQWPTSGKLGSYNGNLKAAKSAKVRDQQAPNEIYTSPTNVTNNNSTPNTNNTPSVVQHSQQHVVSTPTTSSSNSRKKNAAAAAAAAAANQQNAQLQIPKRYACTHCPYSTDRRDLYTRHENIHKDEKPFQCYACLKQFNRADHVKKHFLRMHREMVYDINKTRRNVPSTVSTQQQQQQQQQTHQIDQKPNIFLQQQVGGGSGPSGAVHAENFMTGQRQETSSSLSIAQTIESVATATHTETMPIMKQEKNTGDDITGTGAVKVKREKRFTCCYCPWSGADKWGLKRHLNTHTKPFVCMLCDYKAARSERLATHVLKVHNKKACNKCSFLADNQDEYQAHMNDVHPHDNRPARNNNNNNNSTNINNNTSNNNNLNVLRTIGNTLVSNNQLNNFQNPSTSFGAQSTANSSNNSGVNSYTTTDLNGTNNAMNNGNAGPLQEIMVNPTSMVGWRLSANGSLIPPHDLITGGLAVNANQKRGAERLFQYLEADGSDPEDYARLLKMDAMSRNTASVAQDFHKAGGVDLKNKHQFFNNTITSKHAAASLLLNKNIDNNNKSNHQERKKQTNDNLRSKGFSSCGSTSDETEEDYENMENIENFNSSSDQRKAMSAFLSRNFGLQEKIHHPIPLIKNNNDDNIKMKKIEDIKIKEEKIDEEEQEEHNIKQSSILPTKIVDSIKQQPMKSPPAQPINLTNNKKKNNNNINQLKTNVKQYNNINGRKSTTKTPVINNNNMNNNNNNNSTLKGHRLDLIRDKENSNSIFSTMEYQNLSKFGTQFQNYVKDIINKYYAETPLLFPIVQHQQHLHHNVQQNQQHQQKTVSPPPAKRQKLSETEEYIEYLKNKEDITLTITPKINHNNNNNNNSTKTANITINSTKNHFNNKNSNNIHNQTRPAVIVKQSRTPPRIIEEEPKVQVIPVINYAHGNLQSLVNGNTFYPLTSLKTSNVHVQQQQFSDDDNSLPIDMSSNSPIYDSRRNNRKQAQPKKIKTSPEVVMAQLRDKYLKKMVDRKKSCVICTNNNRKSMLVFPYHTPASLRLHRMWKHSERSQKCCHCNARFSKMYSLKVHSRLVHRK